MLFNSVIFILIFLPVSVIGYYYLFSKRSKRDSLLFLVVCSLFFYGWWEPIYLVLILFSVVINYIVSCFIQKSKNGSRNIKILLISGIVFNLSLLGFFKYFDLLILAINDLSKLRLDSWHIVLPLAISFFTFQQIAYLVDAAQGKVKEKSFLNYVLFVTFFPQLIAGPIVHHSEMMPQFEENKQLNKKWEDISVGITIFTIGLFKKVVLAEQMSYWADATFAASNMGVEVSMLDAWTGVLCFSFQIYFDFSGYTDMAVGAARLFGIKLPLNFFSPYKATNIIDFWRRWHITLSRFLRDYLYIPLGGNKNGSFNRFKNLFIVMLLGGLWHGAGYNFIVWGGLHGIYLILNHAWQYFYKAKNKISVSIVKKWAGRIFTFLLVTYSWVYFRSDSLESAINLSNGLFGINGIVLPMHYSVWFGSLLDVLQNFGVEFGATLAYGGGMQIVWLMGMFCFVWLLPNTQEIMHRHEPTIGYQDECRAKWFYDKLTWVPNLVSALIVSVIAIVLIVLIMQGQPGEFIYFQF